MLLEIQAVLNRVSGTSSNNVKQEIIAEFKDNQEVREALYFLFNDYIVTGLALKKIKKKVSAEPTVKLETLHDTMEYLLKNNNGSDIDIANVQAYVESKPKEHKTFLNQYLTKTYRCGITAKTINKAFGEKFIPEFACQLAHPYSKYAERVQGTFTLTTKLDGHRCLAFVDSLGDTKFFTRKGKEITGMIEITEEVKELSNKSLLTIAQFNQGVVLDGEITLTDTDSIPKDKVFQETGKVVRTIGDKTGLTLNVFDMIPLQEFKNGQSTETYLARRRNMDLLFKHSYEHIKLVKTLYIGSDVSVIQEFLEKQTAQGEEGIMINLDEVYKAKRHPGLLKVKEFFSDDLLVTGIFEGGDGTKYRGKLGGVYVDYKGNKVGVGSGFNDREREEFFEKPELIVGKVIEVQYFEETTTDKDSGISLRFPTYKGIRDDKTAEDVSVES